MFASIASLSKSKSTSMNCSSCKQLVHVHELVRVYDSGPSWKVCGVCLVGFHIPVLRPSTGKWEIGKVISRNGSCSRNDRCRKEHLLKFTNGTKEWVSVGADPYEAYIQCFEDKVDEAYSAKKTSDCFSNRLENSSPHPANVMTRSDQYHYLPRLNSYPNEDGDEDLSSTDEFFNIHAEINHFSIERSQKLFYSAYPSQESLPLTEKPHHIADSPLKKKAGTLATCNQDHQPSANQKCSINKVAGVGSPARSQVSSLTTCSPTSLSSSGTSSRNDSASCTTSSTHRIPRLWTPKEDKLLLETISLKKNRLKNNQLCWPKIALDVPGRTGKQCRERYLNHLGPHLKHTGWTALEDATIFRLFASHGSKWSQIVKSLPGRTDNGIKNRFHHLRRRFERRMKCIPDSKELRLLINKMEKLPFFQRLSPGRFVTRDIAVRILNECPNSNTKVQDPVTGDGEYKFGPFDQTRRSVQCGRCGLIVPSKETGTAVCRQTGWCETCTGVSLVISGDLLRSIHLVRKRSSAYKEEL